MVQHWRQYGRQATMSELLERNPDLDLGEPHDGSLSWVIEQFLGAFYHRRTGIFCSELWKLARDQDERMKMTEHFASYARKLAVEAPASGIARYSDMEADIDRYKADLAAGKTKGLTSGFPSIDDICYGWEPAQLVTVMAPTGVGKSLFLTKGALQAYLMGSSKNGLVVSLEMSGEEIRGRWTTMVAKISRHRMRSYELNDDEMMRWEEAAARARELRHERDIIVLDSKQRPNPDRIWSEVDRRKPDVLIVDYIQLMPGPTGIHNYWERVQHCSREMKAIAQSAKIPVIMAAQENRDQYAQGLSKVGGSYSISQDSDIVLRLYQDEAMKARKQMDCFIEKQRDGSSGGKVPLYWDPDVGDLRDWKGKETQFGERQKA